MKASVGFGMLNGTVNEYVFADNCKNTDNMLSRLDWDIQAIPFFEGDLTFNFFKYLYLNGNGKVGIPGNSGFMQDYDWMNSCPPNGYYHWLADDPTELTNYSKHANKLNELYSLALRIGFNIPFTSDFSITPFIGYKYDFIRTVAYDGYTIYKWNDFRKEDLQKGKGITYGQEMNSMILGFFINSSLIPRIPIESYFQIVPNVSNLIAIDLHHLTSHGFYDEYNRLFAIDWKTSVFFKFDEFNKLGITSLVHYLPLCKGQTRNGPILSDGKINLPPVADTNAEGGAGRFLFSFSLIYQFNL